VQEAAKQDVWYHGSPQRFERFQSRVGHTFGTSASEVPIFLTRDPEFAALYAGPNGYVYEVRPHVERTFDARAFVLSDRYWPPEREALTPEGQGLYDDLVENRIFPELIRYGTRHEDDDEWASMHDSRGTYASILSRNYDVLETTEMKRWLRAHGYDSFLVAGDGPNDNLAVFDPTKVEILGTQSGGMREVRETDESPLEALIEATDARYPRAGEYVDGRLVRDHVPNLDSIEGYMGDQEELPGIRVVPMSDLGNPRSVFYAADDFERAEHLADAIGRSGEISPLIIGIDEKGPFIIEGAHRFVALWHLKAKAFPAVVVVGRG
jgi:hypothetical protein